MGQMAALTERGKVAHCVVAGVVIKVRARQHHAGSTMRGAGVIVVEQLKLRQPLATRPGHPADAPAAIIAPAISILVPPAPVPEMQDLATVWPGAMFTPAFGPPEPDQP